MKVEEQQQKTQKDINGYKDKNYNQLKEMVFLVCLDIHNILICNLHHYQKINNKFNHHNNNNKHQYKIEKVIMEKKIQLYKDNNQYHNNH